MSDRRMSDRGMNEKRNSETVGGTGGDTARDTSRDPASVSTSATTNETATTNDTTNDTANPPDLAQFSAKLKAAIDPQQFPNAHSYIDSSTDYIAAAANRMQNSTNKDQTSKEIANELVQNLQSWMESMKSEKD